MVERTYDAIKTLARAAHSTFSPAQKDLPVFWAMTDPVRTPDVLSLARALPERSGLILRHFGDPSLIQQAQILADIARSRSITFLIARDETLARQVRADGVHWPEAFRNTAEKVRTRHPDWIHTTSAHDKPALRHAHGFDLVFLSPVFSSQSPSAGEPIDPDRISAWINACPIPVYALGGVTGNRLARLKALGFSGCAGVSASSPTD